MLEYIGLGAYFTVGGLMARYVACRMRQEAPDMPLDFLDLMSIGFVAVGIGLLWPVSFILAAVGKAATR